MDHAHIARALFLTAAGWPLAAAAGAAPSLAIVSGTPQTATAYIAQHGARYETPFDTALVVKLSPAAGTVRFRCITHDCAFAPSVQPVAERVDPSAYDVKTANGVASIKLLISTPTVEAVTVSATLLHVAGVPPVRFRLIER